MEIFLSITDVIFQSNTPLKFLRQWLHYTMTLYENSPLNFEIRPLCETKPIFVEIFPVPRDIWIACLSNFSRQTGNYLFRLYKDSLQTFFETLCTCVEIFRLEERRKGKGNKIVDIKAYSIEWQRCSMERHGLIPCFYFETGIYKSRYGVASINTVVPSSTNSPFIFLVPSLFRLRIVLRIREASIIVISG